LKQHFLRRDLLLVGATEETIMFRVRVALLTAIAPTFLLAALLAIAFVVRGTPLAPSWPSRAVAGIALFYLLIVALALFNTRKTDKP